MTDTPRTNATPSETPRVDAFAQEALTVLDGETRAEALAKQWSDFARELERDLERWKYRADVLERDLTAARKELDEAREAANDWSKANTVLVEQRDAAQRDAERMREAAKYALDFLGEQFGNDQGNDWANEDAAAVADALDAALEPSGGE